MYQFLALSVLASLIVGCGVQKDDPFMNTYVKNKAYHQKLGKTESTELTDGFATRAVFVATYLYTPTDEKNDTRDEKFIVNLYFNDEEPSYEDGDYNLTLLASLPKKKKADKKKKEKKEELSEEKKKALLEKKKKWNKENMRLPKSVKRLSNNNPLLKNISLVSPWSRYYLVTFPHLDKKRLYLQLQSDFYGEGHLEFAKVSKFVFTKEPF